MNINKTVISSMLVTLLLGLAPSENISAQVNADYSAVPPETTKSDPPVVMLSLSRDHQYFFKAYNDYTDLDPENTADVDADGNPRVETTYKHSFAYFGYFDSTKCYEHTGGVFDPVGFADADNYCSGQWSGNFLNWATMSRMDVVRKIFYGGSRSTDTATETIIERSFLPSDAHSFAKYYNGRDLGQLTPFGNFNKNGDAGDPDVNLDNIDEGITICNTTIADGTNRTSQDTTSPPLMRIVEGNFQLWGANERWQCTWDDERGNQDNSNVPPSDPRPATGSFPGLNSGIDASDRDPSRLNGTELVVRVRACVAGLEGQERCKQYPNGNLKPIGLLQTYSDDGLIDFGLMTGSYENNIEGGVLRKNTGDLRDEVDVLGDGRFIFTDASDSIIKFLDILRPWGYDYSDGDYRGGGDVDDCDFQLTDVPDGQCRSWGNPITEIFKETVRYMAGLNPTNDFAADDTNFITGMTDAAWVDPLTDENQCSDLNTIVINASVSSYDDDNNDLNDVDGGINGTTIAATNGITSDWTDDVGDQELINGNAFFIGRTAANIDEFCTSKVVGSLADISGLCPEAPTVSGSFGMAGIAYYAHNNDIRSDLEGNQTVNTFTIALATNVPIIKVPRNDGGQSVEILPAYRLLHPTRGEGGGALVDFKIVQPHTSIGNNQFAASYYVNWEDSEQGGDYDQDMWGTIDYILDQTTNTIEISTTTFAQSTANPQLFGFVTNGTTADGFHAYSGILNADYTDPIAGVPGCEGCKAITENGDNPTPQQVGQRGPQSHTFDIAASTVGTLESPLYYAAKYGGFEEKRENIAGSTDLEPVTLLDQPDEITEWDAVNNTTGEDGADGLPDNFFFVINPENLFNSIESALNKILSQDTASSSAVASFANSNGFENIIVQGTYLEQQRGDNDTSVSWTGEIFSYFIDQFGLFREDSQTAGTRGRLDGYAVDRAFRYDIDGGAPVIQYLTVSTDNSTTPPTPILSDQNQVITTDAQIAPISDLNLLWSGGESLRNINNEDTVLQRNYNTVVPDNPAAAGASRYIFTHIDADLDGLVDAGEQIPLLANEIDATNFAFFGQGSIADAQAVVDYTRGFDDPATTGFRSRTLDVTGGQPVVYRLGDLVNSTPAVVAGPSESYDTEFGDTSYAQFKATYGDRRQVAYVGTNDGLLHAFNVGFRDSAESVVEYKTTQGTKTGHPLGAELWAYAPFNLLPHLQWLTSNFYSHVFYVDGSPQTFDAKIFTPSAKHPGGWGTILVVGMRLGGGDFPTAVPNIPAGTGNFVARSAYVVMDITDPEDEPELLAEISDDALNLTTSQPALFYDCGTLCADGDDQNNFNGKWQLIFGSGPNDLKTFTTNETAKVFAYDLETQALEQHDVINNLGGTPVADSFVGAIAVRDWDNGLLGFRNDDVAYFGTVGTRPQIGVPAGSDPIETGGVYRYIPNSPTVADDTVNRLIDVDRPVAQPPLLLSREGLGNNVLGSWVFFGTGIYLERGDEEINAQERFYGVLEPIDSNELNDLSLESTASESFEDSDLLTYTSVTTGDLVNVSNVEVLAEDATATPPIEAGDFRGPLATAGGAINVAELAEFVVTSTQGWFRDLPTGVLADDPTGRIIDRTTALRNQIFFTVFTPASLDQDDICVAGAGESDLFIINQTTGTASAFGSLGADGSGVLNESISLGSGAASAPLLFTSEGLGGNTGAPIIQIGDGRVTSPGTTPPGNGGGGGGTGDSPPPGLPIDNISILRSGWREILQ